MDFKIRLFLLCVYGQSSCRKSEMEIESAQKLGKSIPEAENIICCEETNPELGKHDFIMATVSASTPEKAKGKGICFLPVLFLVCTWSEDHELYAITCSRRDRG